jgi:hypothetical protein
MANHGFDAGELAFDDSKHAALLAAHEDAGRLRSYGSSLLLLAPCAEPNYP